MNYVFLFLNDFLEKDSPKICIPFSYLGFKYHENLGNFPPEHVFVHAVWSFESKQASETYGIVYFWYSDTFSSITTKWNSSMNATNENFPSVEYFF